MKKYNVLFLLLCFQIASFAQNHYNVRLQPIEQGNPTKQCYNLQLATADSKDLVLAGQNYRLYYDASILSYADSKSLLPEEKYANFQSRNFVGYESAQGMGFLPFEEHLGLLSVSVDLDDIKSGGITLNSQGDWKSTCHVCFDRIADKVADEDKASIIWARPELTQEYATAYVEVSEWLGKDITVPAIADQYEDMSFGTTAVSAQTWDEKPLLFPNPVKDNLQIHQPARNTTIVEIVNITGQQVYTGKIEQGDSKHTLNLQQLAAGMYQIRLVKDNQQHIQFFEKQ